MAGELMIAGFNLIFGTPIRTGNYDLLCCVAAHCLLFTQCLCVCILQTGKLLQHIVLPHRIPAQCTIIRLGMCILYTYSVAKRPLPDFANSGDGGWREHFLFSGQAQMAGKPGCYNPLTQKSHLDALKRAFGRTSSGLLLMKIFENIKGGHKYHHALRTTVATALRGDGCTNEQVSGLLWDHQHGGIMDMAYSRRRVPAAALCRAGFQAHQLKTAVIDHLDMPGPPEDAVRAVFEPMRPFELLESLLLKYGDPLFPSAQIDYSLLCFTTTLCKMADLVLRGMGARLHIDLPLSDIWRLPFAARPDVAVYLSECGAYLTPAACKARQYAALQREMPEVQMMMEQTQKAIDVGNATQLSVQRLREDIGLATITSPALLSQLDVTSSLEAVVCATPSCPTTGAAGVPGAMAVAEMSHPSTPPRTSPALITPFLSPSHPKMPGLAIHGNSVSSVLAEWFDGKPGVDPLMSCVHREDWRASIIDSEPVINSSSRRQAQARLRQAISCRVRLIGVLAPKNVRPGAAEVAVWQSRVDSLYGSSINKFAKAIKSKSGIPLEWK